MEVEEDSCFDLIVKDPANNEATDKESTTHKSDRVKGNDEEEDTFYDAGEILSPDNSNKVGNQKPPARYSPSSNSLESNLSQNLLAGKEKETAKNVSIQSPQDDISTEQDSDDSIRKKSQQKSSPLLKTDSNKNSSSFDSEKPCCSKSLFSVDTSSRTITKRIEAVDSSDDSDLEVLSVQKTVQAICHSVADDTDENANQENCNNPENTTMECETIQDSEEYSTIILEEDISNSHDILEEDILKDSQDTQEMTEDSQDTVESTENLQNTEKIQEHLQDAQEITENSQDIQKILNDSQNTQEMTENLQDTEKMLEDSHNTEKITKILQDAVKVSEDLQDTEKGSEDSQVENKISENSQNIEKNLLDNDSTIEAVSKDESKSIGNDDILPISREGERISDNSVTILCEEQNKETVQETSEKTDDAVTSEKLNHDLNQNTDSVIANEAQGDSMTEHKTANDKTVLECVTHRDIENMEIPSENAAIEKSESKENLVGDRESKPESGSVVLKDKHILKEMNCDSKKIDKKICECQVLLNKVDFDEDILRTHKVNFNFFPNGKGFATNEEFSSAGESDKELSESESRRKVRKTKSYFQNKWRNKNNESESSENERKIAAESKRKINDFKTNIWSSHVKRTPTRLSVSHVSKRTKVESSDSKHSNTDESPSTLQSSVSSASHRAKRTGTLASPFAASTVSRSPIPRRAKEKEVSSRTSEFSVQSPPSSRHVKNNESSSPRIRTPSDRQSSPFSTPTRMKVHEPSSTISTPSTRNKRSSITPNKANESGLDIKSSKQLLPSSTAKNTKISETLSKTDVPSARVKESPITENADSRLVKIFSLRTPVISLNRIKWPLQKDHKNAFKESVKSPSVRRSLKFTSKRPRRSLSSENELVPEKWSSDDSDVESKKQPTNKKAKYAKQSDKKKISTFSKQDSASTKSEKENIRRRRENTSSRSKNCERLDSDSSDNENIPGTSESDSIVLSDNDVKRKNETTTSEKSKIREKTGSNSNDIKEQCKLKSSTENVQSPAEDEKQSTQTSSSIADTKGGHDKSDTNENKVLNDRKSYFKDDDKLPQTCEKFSSDEDGINKDEKKVKEEDNDKKTPTKGTKVSDNDIHSGKGFSSSDEQNKKIHSRNDRESGSDVDDPKKKVKNDTGRTESRKRKANTRSKTDEIPAKKDKRISAELLSSDGSQIKKISQRRKLLKKSTPNQTDSPVSSDEEIKFRKSKDQCSSDSDYQEKTVRKRQIRSQKTRKTNIRKTEKPKLETKAKCEDTDSEKNTASSDYEIQVVIIKETNSSSESQSESDDEKKIDSKTGAKAEEKRKKIIESNKVSEIKDKKISVSSDESEVDKRPEKRESMKKAASNEAYLVSSDEENEVRKLKDQNSSDSHDDENVGKKKRQTKSRERRNINTNIAEKQKLKGKNTSRHDEDKVSDKKERSNSDSEPQSDSSDVKRIANKTQPCPKGKLKKTTEVDKTSEIKDQKSSNAKIHSVSSDEDAATTKNAHSNSDNESSEDSDQDEKSIKRNQRSTRSNAKQKSYRNIKETTRSRRTKDDTLKQLIKLSGVCVKSFSELWEGCRTYAQKSERVYEFLKEKGFTGPLNEKNCKNFSVKRELDVNPNVIITPPKERKYTTRNSKKQVAKRLASPTSPATNVSKKLRRRIISNSLSDSE